MPKERYNRLARLMLDDRAAPGAEGGPVSACLCGTLHRSKGPSRSSDTAPSHFGSVPRQGILLRRVLRGCPAWEDLTLFRCRTQRPAPAYPPAARRCPRRSGPSHAQGPQHGPFRFVRDSTMPENSCYWPLASRPAAGNAWPCHPRPQPGRRLAKPRWQLADGTSWGTGPLPHVSAAGPRGCLAPDQTCFCRMVPGLAYSGHSDLKGCASTETGWR